MIKKKELTASEAIHGFMGWLTTRDAKIEVGASCYCDVVVSLIDEFCKVNRLEDPRDDWADILIHPAK